MDLVCLWRPAAGCLGREASVVNLFCLILRVSRFCRTAFIFETWLLNCLASGYVRNRLFYFGSVSVRFLKKNWFSSEFVWFGSVQKAQFGSDIMIIYYSCNSWLVNLQRILQRQWVTWHDLTLLTSLTTTTTSKKYNCILKSTR